jgi:hypothetical protein
VTSSGGLIDDPAASCRVLGYQRTQQAAGNGPVEIHANHIEAFNGSLRRRNSAYQRKTHTYAKKTTGLQRTLGMLWIAHNFIRKHFTTKKVPAVALGILKEGLSWEQMLKIQRLPIFSI